MHNPPPPSTSALPQSHPEIQELPYSFSSIPDDPTCSSSLFDWSDFVASDLDDPFAAITFDHEQHQTSHMTAPELEPVSTPTDELGQTRKRDQRLVCPNFLAGRIPCACPELDEKLEKEEEMLRGGAGKKRVRSLKAPTGSTARCQVPDCEADISELKGYHRRHRVCLRCAYSSSVVLDRQEKRYCQQCGKFHILSDFDEGKRSCRRKLEHHNNRRRRRPADGKGVGEKESLLTTFSENVSCEDDANKDSMCLSNLIIDKETLLESEGQVSTLCSAHDSNNIQGANVVSFAASGETQIEGEKENLKCNQSLSYDDNKSAFSSMCPTGRISFKLYDWNPAEFPRRLRLQIFQWLASMPVELEGYIRPGCTILTIFIAMPKIMWVKLSEEPAEQLLGFVTSPGNLLSGHGTFLAYLNNMIYNIVEEKGVASVVKLNLKEQVPELRYVHPTCFEAGKPLEFVACGSNLLQPKFRFLVSFAGKYLACNCSVLSLHKSKDSASNLNHHLVKVSVSQMDPTVFGPAFVEVENESGLSNFIPILIAHKEICAEMKKIEQRLAGPLSSERPEIASTCLQSQVSDLTQARFSQLITDVAWSVKKPVLENTRHWIACQIQRTYKLLNVLIQHESTATLESVLHNFRTWTDKCDADEALDAEMEHLRISVTNARLLVYQKQEGKGHLTGGSLHQNYLKKPSASQVTEVTDKCLSDTRQEATMRLLTGEVVVKINIKDRSGKSCSPLLTPRPFILVITAVTICLGLCAALLHPQKVGEIAVTIRRSLSA